MDVESNASSSSAAAKPSTSASPSPPYTTVEDFSRRVSVETTERRLLELELMHHFTSSTVHSGFLSAHDEDILQMWWKKTPVLAFKHPFLLNVIISIAALHITKITPQRTDMADVHRIYFNAAVSQLRHAVQDINTENAEAVCISNILIALPSFILLQNPDSRSYCPPFELFSILASNISLFAAAWPLLSESSPIMAFATAEPDMRIFVKEVRQDKHRQPFLKLLSWRAAGEEVDEESQDAYDFALCFVGCILINIENKVHPSLLRRMVYSFPTWVPNIFVTRLKEWKPRALTILAYYFALSKAMDNVWYAAPHSPLILYLDNWQDSQFILILIPNETFQMKRRILRIVKIVPYPS